MQFSRKSRSANINFVRQTSIPSTLFQNGKQFVTYLGCYLFSEYLWVFWSCSRSSVRKKKSQDTNKHCHHSDSPVQGVEVNRQGWCYMLQVTLDKGHLGGLQKGPSEEVYLKAEIW